MIPIYIRNTQPRPRFSLKKNRVNSRSRRNGGAAAGTTVGLEAGDRPRRPRPRFSRNRLHGEGQDPARPLPFSSDVFLVRQWLSVSWFSGFLIFSRLTYTGHFGGATAAKEVGYSSTP